MLRHFIYNMIKQNETLLLKGDIYGKEIINPIYEIYRKQGPDFYPDGCDITRNSDFYI